MFWLGFLSGVFAVLVVIAIIVTITMIIAYKGAPLAEEEE